MTTPDQTPDIELEAQELTDENLEEVIGGIGSPKLMGTGEVLGSTGSPAVVYSAYTDQLTNTGGNVGDG
jgi:hypothetical protein